KPGSKVCRQAVDSVNRLRAMSTVERGVDFREIPDVRPMHNRATQLGSLNRILPAMSDQRTADEHCGRQPVKQAKLTARVGDINIGRTLGQFSARAQCRAQTRRRGEVGNVSAALGMPRRNQSEQVRKITAKAGVSLKDQGFLAVMR